jgi:transposase
LDNASVHQSKLMQQNLPVWQKRGFFIFFFVTYSPHLNIAKVIWQKLKAEWIVPEDYLEKDSYCMLLTCMANIGSNLKVNFSPFNAN